MVCVRVHMTGGKKERLGKIIKKISKTNNKKWKEEEMRGRTR